MNKTAISVLVVVMIGVAVFAWTRRAPEAAHGSQNDVARLEAQVATLKQQISTQRSTVAQPTGTSSSTSAPSHVVPRTPAEKHEWIKARGAFYTSQVEAEKRDDEWASRTEKQARDVALNRPTITVKSVECRTTLCRMAFGYPNRETRQEHLASIPGSMPDLPRVAFEYINGQHGEVGAVLYLARTGHNLPEFDWQPTHAP